MLWLRHIRYRHSKNVERSTIREGDRVLHLKDSTLTEVSSRSEGFNTLKKYPLTSDNPRYSYCKEIPVAFIKGF